MKNFREQVEKEIADSHSENGDIVDFHQGYGLLAEEVDEFWDEVKKKTKKRNTENLSGELVQIAALAESIYYDVVMKNTMDSKKKK